MLIGRVPFGFSALATTRRAASAQAAAPPAGTLGYAALGRMPWAFAYSGLPAVVLGGAIPQRTGTAGASLSLPAAAGDGYAPAVGPASASIHLPSADAAGHFPVDGVVDAALPFPGGVGAGDVVNDASGAAQSALALVSVSAEGRFGFWGPASAGLPLPDAQAAGKKWYPGVVSDSLPPIQSHYSNAGVVPYHGAIALQLPSFAPDISGRFSAPTQDTEPDAVERYTAELTGDADGKDPHPIKISAFQARYRESGSGYGSVTVPGIQATVQALSDRPNGEVVVWWTKGDITEEVLRFAPTYIRTDRGAESRSATMSGNFSLPEHLSQLYTSTRVSYISQYQGTLRYRIPSRGGMRPHDRIRYGGKTSTVSEVSWNVSIGQQTFEIEVRDET